MLFRWLDCLLEDMASLQYLFPFYTAGLFFIGLRYSSKLLKLLGSWSVPTLATLLFLSYTKLLRTIITALELSRLTNYTYPNISSYYVWSIDGRLYYGQFPHITLLLMAIGCLLILWLPYTTLLFLMQWLRRIPNFMISKWIMRYKPVIDAYFAPLKDKHHYWFGVLLLSWGILLLTSTLTANINPAVSHFLLLCVTTFLLCYMNLKGVYRKTFMLSDAWECILDQSHYFDGRSNVLSRLQWQWEGHFNLLIDW